MDKFSRKKARIAPGLLRRMRRDSAAAAVDRKRAGADGGALALFIPSDSAGLYGERPAGRLAQLARISGRKLELVAA